MRQIKYNLKLNLFIHLIKEELISSMNYDLYELIDFEYGNLYDELRIELYNGLKR